MKAEISKQEYARIHWWLRKNYGKPTKCENESCLGRSKTYTWALLHNKTYKENRKNFIQLCKSCHTKYDLTEDGRKRMSLSKIGKPSGMFGKKVSKKTKLKMRLAHLGRKYKPMLEISKISRRKRVMRISDINEEYESLSLAAKLNNLPISSISHCINGKTKTAGGYKWKIYEQI